MTVVMFVYWAASGGDIPIHSRGKMLNSTSGFPSDRGERVMELPQELNQREGGTSVRAARECALAGTRSPWVDRG